MQSYVRNKVIVRLWGGLGNQMFQYATARQLSLLNDAELKIDNTFFNSYKLWPFELFKLNIQAELASNDEILEMDNGTLWKPLIPLIEKIPWIRIKDFIRRPFSFVVSENQPTFNPSLLDTRAEKIYLKGYWSSYKYFNNIRNILLEDFKFKTELDEGNLSFADKIKEQENSVFLHVRRGDYVSTKENTGFYRSPYADGFYDRAIESLLEKVNNPVFFIFSDDPEWVKENIKLDFKTFYVNINKGDNNYLDMYLMSLCKHSIIANSTFSWWAAWLNKNPDKLVFAPKTWFMNSTEKSMNDMLPPNWIRL